MSGQPPFAGYCAQVWATCWQAIDWLNGLAAGGAAPAASLAAPTSAVFATLRNGSSAVSAWQAGAALTAEAQALVAVQDLPLTLTPQDRSYLNARAASVAAAASGIAALPPVANPFGAVQLLAAGSPAIADPKYLEWCQGFMAETPPAGYTDIPTSAASVAQGWLDIANAIYVLQGSSPTVAYDTAARMYRCSATVASLVSQLNAGPFAADSVPGYAQQELLDSDGNPVLDSNGNPIYATVYFVPYGPWNGAVALPTILLDAAAQSTSPASLAAQQACTIRYALNAVASGLAMFLYSLNTAAGTQPTTARLRNADSLQDLAARQTGSFDNWPAIAAANALSPPYPGPTNPAVALSGRQLYMPGSGVQVGAAGAAPNYDNLTLGVDYDFGPINGLQPGWSGDIPLIAGLYNYARAIGRRLQTPLGALVYHQNYGSRIPPEVGAIQDSTEAARLAEYGRSAMAADPRTGAVLYATATVQPGFLATFSGGVTPIGPSAVTVQVSAAISPFPLQLTGTP